MPSPPQPQGGELFDVFAAVVLLVGRGGRRAADAIDCNGLRAVGRHEFDLEGSVRLLVVERGVDGLTAELLFRSINGLREVDLRRRQFGIFGAIVLAVLLVGCLAGAGTVNPMVPAAIIAAMAVLNER